MLELKGATLKKAARSGVGALRDGKDSAHVKYLKRVLDDTSNSLRRVASALVCSAEGEPQFGMIRFLGCGTKANVPD